MLSGSLYLGVSLFLYVYISISLLYMHIYLYVYISTNDFKVSLVDRRHESDFFLIDLRKRNLISGPFFFNSGAKPNIHIYIYRHIEIYDQTEICIYIEIFIYMYMYIIHIYMVILMVKTLQGIVKIINLYVFDTKTIAGNC